jgi:hypothetical protein
MRPADDAGDQTFGSGIAVINRLMRGRARLAQGGEKFAGADGGKPSSAVGRSDKRVQPAGGLGISVNASICQARVWGRPAECR